MLDKDHKTIKKKRLKRLRRKQNKEMKFTRRDFRNVQRVIRSELIVTDTFGAVNVNSEKKDAE